MLCFTGLASACWSAAAGFPLSALKLFGFRYLPREGGTTEHVKRRNGSKAAQDDVVPQADNRVESAVLNMTTVTMGLAD